MRMETYEYVGGSAHQCSIVNAVSRSPFDQRDRPVPVKAAPYTEAEPQPTPPVVESTMLALSPTYMELAKQGRWKAWSLPSPFISKCPSWVLVVITTKTQENHL